MHIEEKGKEEGVIKYFMDGMDKEIMDVSVTGVPVEEVPATEAPIEEVPTTEAPVEEVPTTEAPVEEVPATEMPIEESNVTETPGMGQWQEIPMMQQLQPGQWNSMYMSQPVYPGQWQEMQMSSSPQPGQWNTIPQQQSPMGQQYVPWNAVPQGPYGQWNNVPPTMQNQNMQWNNVPQWNNGMPVYPTGGYQNPAEPKKKSGYTVLIILLVLLGILIIGGMILAGYNILNKVNKVNSDRKEKVDNNIGDDWYDFDDWDDNYPYEEKEDEVEDNSFDWKKDSNGNYVPTENDPYYMEFVDSISEDLTYKVKKDIYEYSNANNNVNIYIETPIIENENIENTDVLNKHIADTTAYLLKNYANNPEKGDVYDCEITVNSYITYMDEDILSIVIDQRISMAGTADFMLSSFNIDMKTGQLLWNRQLLNYTDELAKEFRRMSDYQNGSIDYLKNISNEELLYALTAEGTSVAFYTPVGMEIGFSYNDSINVGWVTATIKDYEKYQ